MCHQNSGRRKERGKIEKVFKEKIAAENFPDYDKKCKPTGSRNSEFNINRINSVNPH